jgi:AraC-like DNA-binding protein
MGPHCRPGDPNPRDSVLLWIEFLPFCAHVHFCTTLDGEHSSGEGCYVLDAGLYESVNHLGAELRDRRAHHERIARDCLFRILLQVHRGIGEGAAFVSSGGEIEKMAGGSPTDIATRVERFLRANYNRHLTLRDICRGCYASRSLVCREFAKSEGAGVMKYLARLRVGVAKRLLASNLKVGEIARLVGFNDPYHFSRKFAQVEGISPRAWRRKHLSQKVRI